MAEDAQPPFATVAGCRGLLFLSEPPPPLQSARIVPGRTMLEIGAFLSPTREDTTYAYDAAADRRLRKYNLYPKAIYESILGVCTLPGLLGTRLESMNIAKINKSDPDPMIVFEDKTVRFAVKQRPGAKETDPIIINAPLSSGGEIGRRFYDLVRCALCIQDKLQFGRLLGVLLGQDLRLDAFIQPHASKEPLWQ
jgi:hypothetical protein